MSASPQFGLEHAAYRRFRPTYPEQLYARIFAQLGPERVLAVDLGAGTGLVSAVLGRHFHRVVAVEPDASMSAHLHETAPMAEIQSVDAELASFEPGSVDLVTCANAFHWMRGPEVAAAVAEWLHPGGVFAGWRYPMPELPIEVADLLRDELVRWSAFLDPRGLDMRNMQTSFGARSEFELLADEVLANPVPLGVDALIGFLHSVSFVAAFLRSLGPEHRRAYVDDLTTRLRERIGDGEVVLEFPLTLVVARRRATRQ
jgi:trans-aconitate methyltransferase